MSQWLRTVIVLSRDLCLVPSTYMVNCNCPCYGALTPLLTFKGTSNAHGAQIYMQAKHSHTQNKESLEEYLPGVHKTPGLRPSTAQSRCGSAHL